MDDARHKTSIVIVFVFVVRNALVAEVYQTCFEMYIMYSIICVSVSLTMYVDPK